MRLVLASASPRRAALLRAAGYAFDVRPSGVAEWAFAGGDPAAYAEALARAKAEDGPHRPDDVVVAADTVVVVDGDVLGKPADAVHAAAMLRRLSGRSHEVVTGIVVRRGTAVGSGHDTARVTFRPLTDAEIDAYVATAEPLDKAGAYAYQGRAGAFVTALAGDADTVIGLPLRLLDRLLAQL
ncbi:MAG TPA: Maf family protein [Candidatus Dormibacteraeota bacterium]|nr:Maf family protein [Candidatus Dormibacteraeota bacterium]